MKISFNIKNIDMINEKANLALWDTAEAIRTDLVQSQTVPKDQGHLESDMFTDPKILTNIKGVVKISNPQIYSRKMYFHPEYRFNKNQNPNAGARWFDIYKYGTKKDLPLKYYKNALQRRMQNG